MHNSVGIYPILRFGTREQKQQFGPPMAAGESIGAFCLTEANAGSDAGGVETVARKTDHGFVLNGTKIFVTNGGICGTILVFALSDTDPAHLITNKDICMLHIIVCIKQVPMVSELPWDPKTGTLKRETAQGHDGSFCPASPGSSLADKGRHGKKPGQYHRGFHGTAQVGPQLAEALDIPAIGYARRLELVHDCIRVERHVDDFMELMEMDLPGLVTIDHAGESDLYTPRYVALGGVEAAFNDGDIRIMDGTALRLDKNFNALTSSPTKIISL